MRCRDARAGVSLIELMIVIAIMSIMAASVITSGSPTIQQQLDAAAQIVMSDMDYFLSLATSNGSSYRVTFNLAQQQYVMKHTGSDNLLDALPEMPFRSLDDPTGEHIVRLADLPGITTEVRLYAVLAMSNSPRRITELEFTPLGSTIEAEDTVLWLAAGSSGDRRYIPIQINAVTGLASVGEMQTTAPAVPLESEDG